MKISISACALVALQLLLPSATVASEDYTCTAPRQQPEYEEWKACNARLYPSEPTSFSSLPDVWQKTLCWNNEDAAAVNDLAIIGAGIGGAYMANQLRLSKKHNSSIAMFEAGHNVGGRLMSSFHSGALGLSVRHFDKVNNVAPPEYGGMRITPHYKRVWEQTEKLWHREFKKDARKDAKCEAVFCSNWANVDLCCDGLLTPMNVGNAYYHSDSMVLGGRLMQSSLTDKNPLYGKDGAVYNVKDVENYKDYSPFVQCLLLAVGAEHYKDNIKDEGKKKELMNTIASEVFDMICKEPECNKIKGMCGLCGLFPKDPAAAVVSCSGYNLDPKTYSVSAILSLADEVLNIKNNQFFYLYTVGYQRLAQSILSGTEVDDDDSGYQDIAVAPHFGKQLVAIGVGPGNFDEANKRAHKLAQMQVERFRYNKAVEYDVKELGPLEPIQFKFSDGSMTNSHMAYLTMLPRDSVGTNPDAPAIKGFGPWFDEVNDNVVNNLAFKAVIEWDDFSLAEELGMIPCVQIKNATSVSGKCDRIILDGDPKTQVVRQAWPWDYKQILLYTAGDQHSPGGNSINTAQEYGMERLLKKSIEELRDAVKGIKSKTTGKQIEIPDPTWFRGKMWPNGSLLVFWPPNTDSDRFSEAFRRPFGEKVNIWYGNSELDQDGSNHGWAEGALSMVDTSLSEIEPKLEQYVKMDTEACKA